jgi:hypothetical protein
MMGNRNKHDFFSTSTSSTLDLPSRTPDMDEFFAQTEHEKTAREFETELQILRKRLRYRAERGPDSETNARLSVIAFELEGADCLDLPDEIRTVIIYMVDLIVCAADLTRKTPGDCVH